VSARRARVALVGLGPIGIEIGRAVLARSDLQIKAAVDPAFAGRRLSDLVPGTGRIPVEKSLAEALAQTPIDVVALATGSRLAAVVPDLETAIRARVHLVSTCEELAAPSVDPKWWARLDGRARKAGVTLLGTGVNPGFVMDRLVLQLAGAAVRVDKVTVERVVDAAKRRTPLRKKVGEGLSAAEFRAGVRAGRLGHVGLRESATLVAAGLGWTLERYQERIEPVLGDDGRCLGLRQLGRGWVAGKERITLRLAMYVGAAEPHDRLLLDGDPPLDVRIGGGTHGDRGTIGTVVNALGRVARAPRGLVTVGDVFV
jgi:4-hydroxy-tetrahydrodipicolinate reductase